MPRERAIYKSLAVTLNFLLQRNEFVCFDTDIKSLYVGAYKCSYLQVFKVPLLMRFPFARSKVRS